MKDERGRDGKEEREKSPSRNNWDAIMMKDSSEIILSNWYRTAHKNVFGPKGRKRHDKRSGSGLISDDNEEDFEQRRWLQLPRYELPSSTSTIATFWLRSARARLQHKSIPR